jgi:secondary thiamine-phosphate synthase enzyme
MESIYDRLVPENAPYYEHTLEGSDDMPAHAKCIITGVSTNIPITSGRLNLGTWQGIYLCEFRNSRASEYRENSFSLSSEAESRLNVNDGGARSVVATIVE